MKFNTFWLNPGHVLVHFGPVLVQWLKKKSMWTSTEIAIFSIKNEKKDGLLKGNEKFTLEKWLYFCSKMYVEEIKGWKKKK